MASATPPASSFFMSNNSEPRPPPRFLQAPVPTPPDILEKPQFLVPDVSLIFDSSSKSGCSVTSTGSANWAAHHLKQAAELRGGPTKPLPEKGNNFGTSSLPFYTGGQSNSIRSTSTQMSASGRQSNSAPGLRSNFDDRSESNIESNQQWVRESQMQIQNLQNHFSQEQPPNTKRYPSSSPTKHNARKNNDVGIIVEMITKQGESISNIQDQIHRIVEFQENFLSQLFNKGSAESKEVQTDGEILGWGQKSERSQSGSSSSSSLSTQKDRKSDTNTETQKQTSTANIPIKVNHTNEQPRPPAKNKSRQRTPSPKNVPLLPVRANSARVAPAEITRNTPDINTHQQRKEKENSEDLSIILRDLQLPQIEDTSMYSEVSYRPLDIQDYNDSINYSEANSPQIGPSISAYGSSSSEDETGQPVVQPTVTFYRNLLGNVNRMLDNNDCSATREPSPEYHQRGRHAIIKESSIKGRQRKDQQSRASTATYSGSSNSDRSERKSQNRKNPCRTKEETQNDQVTDATKKYLEKLGVQFSSADNNEVSGCGNQASNVMIQQNVYNSIFIPSLKCAPLAPESLESNSPQFNKLTRKYIPQDEMHKYEPVKAHDKQMPGSGSTDTTMYGMSSNHLSFSTKQYLQRYGLVNQDQQPNTRADPIQHTKFFSGPPHDTSTDRILDMTALRNQPKLI